MRGQGSLNLKYVSDARATSKRGGRTPGAAWVGRHPCPASGGGEVTGGNGTTTTGGGGVVHLSRAIDRGLL